MTKLPINAIELREKTIRKDEREKVLNEVERKILEKQEIILEGHIPAVWSNDIQNIFKELHKDGEP
jgi:hypothetical protein